MSYLADSIKGVIIHVCVLQVECDVWRHCGVCGVDCLFPQSESAPLTVFERTLHSSAAQLNHKPSAMDSHTKSYSIYMHKKFVKKRNPTNQHEDTTPQRKGRAERPELRQVRVEG